MEESTALPTRRLKSKPTAGTARADQLIPSADAATPIPAEAYRENENVDSAGPQLTVSASTVDTGTPQVSTPWGGIVSDYSTIDVASTYTRLKSALTLGDGATEYGHILAAMDAAERNCLDASLLARAAKLEEQRVDRECQELLEVLRTQARNELELEKAAGTRSKAPTIQDIDDRMTANWTVRVRGLKRSMEEMHGARAICDALVDSWDSRAQTLRTMAQRYAPTRLGA